MSDGAVTGNPFVDHALEHLISGGGSATIVFIFMKARLADLERLTRGAERFRLWRQLYRMKLKEHATTLNRHARNIHRVANAAQHLALDAEARGVTIPEPSEWAIAEVSTDFELEPSDDKEKDE